MLTSLRTFWRSARRLWSTTEVPALPASGTLLHDPAASGPHDLDDPFFDPQVQERVSDIIASAARKKPGTTGSDQG
jgi:hypothetical protein